MDLQTSYKDIRLPKMLYENYIEDKLEQDLIIPDYYCSAQKIVHCEANAVVLNSGVSDDKVILEGVCSWKILYLSDEDKALHHISCERNFTEIFAADSAKGNLRYKIKTKNVLCKLQSPTRADCKATLCIAVKVDGTESKRILAGASDSNVQLRQEDSPYFELALRCEKEFRISGELPLKYRKEYGVLKTNSEIIVRECKCFEGKALIKGICKSNVILLSKEACEAETVEIETTFSQVFEAQTIEPGWMPCVHCKINESDATISSDGDDEILMVSNNIVADLDIYSQKPITVVTDAYHLNKELICKKEKIEFYRDIQNIEIMTHLSQKAHLNTSDMSVLYFESRAEIEKIDVGEGTMIIDGKLLVDFVYSLNEGVYYNTFSFPFQSTKPIEGEFESLKCEAVASVNNFGFLILSDNEMEISCDCRVLLTVYTLDIFEGITEIEAGENKSEEVLKTPLVLYYGSKGEKIWDICKKYSVPVQAVVENNDIDGGILSDDHLVFITKH